MGSKIFGIGLPKTGQTSLAAAMQSLGFKTIQYPDNLKQIQENDFVLDLPITSNYKKLDKKYPNSRFIMTFRDFDTWIQSIKNHYRRFPASTRDKTTLHFRSKFWGTTHFDKRVMTQKYFDHIKDVNEYFENKKKDLLIINVVSGEGWKKLCPFLDKKIPKKQFPKENIGIYSASKTKT